MLSASSNCSRIDAVKASANQLRLQVPQGAGNGQSNSRVQAANRQLQTVDATVRTGNAEKSELALSSARTAVQQLTYSAPNARPRAVPADGPTVIAQPHAAGRIDTCA
ncbi:MAG TPA: hypothetical protein VMI92_04530 [Steroidobacteraceae bacterium]|nr:hypothetical protein [Steroidobacteraceae bacterium]